MENAALPDRYGARQCHIGNEAAIVADYTIRPDDGTRTQVHVLTNRRPLADHHMRRKVRTCRHRRRSIDDSGRMYPGRIGRWRTDDG